MTLNKLAWLGLLVWVAGCQTAPDPTHLSVLTGRAILPAHTFSPGPAVGHQLEPEINGVQLPLQSVPVQGFSSLHRLSETTFLALQDNGFGTRNNSPRFPLRWYELEVDLESNKPNGGPVTVNGFVTLSDPDRHFIFPLVQPDSTRVLHGGDFDPESCVVMEDRTIWIGEEFGPYLLHFDAQGKLLAPPVLVPVAGPLRPYGRGSYFLRSPDNPDLTNGKNPKPIDELANVPRSGGIEGLAAGPEGKLLYLTVEKAMIGDPDQKRRTILEFDPGLNRFTSRFWFYPADSPKTSLASLEWVNSEVFLVLERGPGQGADAQIKRIYQVDLSTAKEGVFLEKKLVCDLLNIRDSFGFSTAEEGAIGLGPHYQFPYVTPEAMLLVDHRTLILCNDNNYPMSSGRRADVPDDNEFIRIQLSNPLTGIR